MKKLAFCLFLAGSLFVSCSDDDSSNTNDNGNGLSNNPVSGQLYGQAFNIQGGRASLTSFFNIESVQIDISSQAIGCEASSDNFPIRIIAPRQEGTFTTDVYVSFNDPNSTDYVSISSGNTVEITELTATSVKGRVRSVSSSTDNSVNGAFEVPICPE
jgi:hypothetical protein